MQLEKSVELGKYSYAKHSYGKTQRKQQAQGPEAGKHSELQRHIAKRPPRRKHRERGVKHGERGCS